MTLEFRSSEMSQFDNLWQAWETKSDYELESTFTPLDYTSLLNIIKQLRSIGLQEIPTVPRLNIMVEGNLRFTLEGKDLIQEYCRDNTLNGKMFTVMLKEKKVLKGGSSEVDIREYGIRIKLRHELKLTNDDPRVQSVLKKWASLPKAFRYIKRYSFLSTHQKGIQFDASFVRENKKDARNSYILATTFTEAQIQKQDVTYEMELEAIREDKPTQKSFLIGCAIVLRGIQKSYILTRASVKMDVLQYMSAKTGMSLSSERGRIQGFPGVKPVTLRKEHMGVDTQAELPNIRYGDYNVTDKADGLRCLLVVHTTGRIYLLDMNMNVYGTDRFLEGDMIKQCAGVVLDGEWVTQNKENEAISHFYAFDILNGMRGEDVTTYPFYHREVLPKPSRHAALQDVIAALSVSNSLGIQSTKHKLAIFMKTFVFPTDPKNGLGIFAAAKTVLDRTNLVYHTDGLIFTPNLDSLPKNGKTWMKQFKWKPASMNSVDFLVVTEKERDMEGKPKHTEYIQYDEAKPGQMVRCKTLHLFVGSSIDPLRMDPRDTILYKRPLPSSERTSGAYRPVEFYVTPADPMASICRVALPMEELSDDTIVCEETKDPINDRTIVEMIYKPDNLPGWRWVPLRVRWDKTELFARGEVGRTMNDFSVATDVWNSIHDPITETMICTGNMTDESLLSLKPSTYYKRKAGQDRYITGGMLDFHNRYIKDRILLSSTIQPGAAVLDMSVGRAGDLHKWLHAKVGWVLGCDISLSGLTEKEGAYDRYLTEAVKKKGNIAKMVFVQADSSQRYSDGSAGIAPLDKSILQCLWGTCGADVPPYVKELEGKAGAGFDVVTSMFALHYFFKTGEMFQAFLQNLAETVKVGGYFVGCCTDGEEVTKLLRTHSMGESVSGSEGEKQLWKITKQYEDMYGFLPSDESGIGRAIDVNFISIGETHTEYLVSFEYLKSRLAEIGLDLLNAEELRTFQMRNSSNLFGESYDMAKEQGLTYPIPPSLKTFSFLSRWFIFRRRATGASSMLSEPLPATGGATDLATVDVQPNDGPIYQFYHKSKPKDELQVGDKNWRRVLSPFSFFPYHDLQDPSIQYSSLEAAIGSAKFQYGTNRPELGPQIFSTHGNLHQDFVQKQFRTNEPISEEEEGMLMRSKQKPAEIKKTGAKWVANDWESKQEDIYRAYLQQRYNADEMFRRILQRVKEQHARLVFYSPSAPELGGTAEQNTIQGKNILGNILLQLA